MLLFEEVL